MDAGADAESGVGVLSEDHCCHQRKRPGIGVPERIVLWGGQEFSSFERGLTAAVVVMMVVALAVTLALALALAFQFTESFEQAFDLTLALAFALSFAFALTFPFAFPFPITISGAFTITVIVAATIAVACVAAASVATVTISSFAAPTVSVALEHAVKVVTLVANVAGGTASGAFLGVGGMLLGALSEHGGGAGGHGAEHQGVHGGHGLLLWPLGLRRLSWAGRRTNRITCHTNHNPETARRASLFLNWRPSAADSLAIVPGRGCRLDALERMPLSFGTTSFPRP